METELHEINVTLSDLQKEYIFRAYLNRGKILLRLGNDALRGSDTLLVPQKSLHLDSLRCVPDKETILDSYEQMEYTHNCKKMPGEEDIAYHLLWLKKGLFSEMYDNDFLFFPSINDKGVRYFKLITPPTVVERLEKARKKNEGMEMFLDYSLLTDTTKYSVFKNMGKLMENIPSLTDTKKYSIY